MMPGPGAGKSSRALLRRQRTAERLAEVEAHRRHLTAECVRVHEELMRTLVSEDLLRRRLAVDSAEADDGA